MTYTVLEFRVANTGNYNFSLRAPARGHGKHTLLYEDGFDPESPLLNLLTGNDSAKGGMAFSYALTRGKRYCLVIVSVGDELVDPYAYTIAGAGHVIHLSGAVGQQFEHFEQMAPGLAVLLATSRRKSVSQSLGRPAALLSQVRSSVSALGHNVHDMGAVPVRPPIDLVATGGITPQKETPLIDRSQSGVASGTYVPLKSFLRNAG